MHTDFAMILMIILIGTHIIALVTISPLSLLPLLCTPSSCIGCIVAGTQLAPASSRDGGGGLNEVCRVYLVDSLGVSGMLLLVLVAAIAADTVTAAAAFLELGEELLAAC